MSKLENKEAALEEKKYWTCFGMENTCHFYQLSSSASRNASFNPVPEYHLMV